MSLGGQILVAIGLWIAIGFVFIMIFAAIRSHRDIFNADQYQSAEPNPELIDEAGDALEESFPKDHGD